MSVAQRVQAVEAMLVAGADAEGASVVATGTPLMSWLQLAGNLERREASGIVCTGKELAAYPAVRDAAVAGRVSYARPARSRTP